MFCCEDISFPRKKKRSTPLHEHKPENAVDFNKMRCVDCSKLHHLKGAPAAEEDRPGSRPSGDACLELDQCRPRCPFDLSLPLAGEGKEWILRIRVDNTSLLFHGGQSEQGRSV